MSKSVEAWLTGGGLAALLGIIGIALKGVYLLGSILESFRQHVKSSDDTHRQYQERLTYMERRVP